MTAFTVTDREGRDHRVVGEAGWSLMEAIRAAGVDELQALCGGCCSCATCHVYVDATGLPPVSDDEDALLDASAHRRAESRLSCQIEVDALPADAQIRIAPED